MPIVETASCSKTTDRPCLMSSVYGNQPVDTNKRLEKRFKAREDEYITYTQFHILVGTFNVNNRQAPNNQLLEEWLHRQSDQSDRKVNTFPDIVAVGFQEIDTGGGAYFIDDKKKEDEWEYVVRKTIQSSYHPKDEKNRFQLLDRVRLMGKIAAPPFRSINISSSRYFALRLCAYNSYAQMYPTIPYFSCYWFYGYCREQRWRRD